VERTLVRDGAEAQQLAQAEVLQRVREDAAAGGRRCEVISRHDFLSDHIGLLLSTPQAQHTGMELLIALLLTAIIGVLAQAAGNDSWDADTRNNQPAW
jgi:hypothetical protein